MGANTILSDILTAAPPRAGSCIVTVYGDVAVPRGGSLWMGNLIEICAELGLSESLVRTAMSRLVAAGQVEGKRIGRRSYYQLTPRAQIEFSRASQLIFSRIVPPENWVWVIGGNDGEALAARGFAEVANGLWLGPEGASGLETDGTVMRAETVAQSDDLEGFVAKHWDLDRQQRAYGNFIARFAPLAAGEPDKLAPDRALIARLALIHDYRLCLLADPRLPDEGLPKNWNGSAAQALFAELYAALSPQAEAHIAARFETEDGPMPRQTPESAARLAALSSDPE